MKYQYRNSKTTIKLKATPKFSLIPKTFQAPLINFLIFQTTDA